MAKRGRKHKPYQDANGNIYPGLSRRSDGRFYITSTGKELGSDQTMAIARYRQFRAEQEGQQPVVSLSVMPLAEQLFADLADAWGDEQKFDQALKQRTRKGDLKQLSAQLSSVPKGMRPLIGSCVDTHNTWHQYCDVHGLDTKTTDPAHHWKEYTCWVIRTWILTDPKGAAKELNLPHLAEGPAVKPPPPSQPLAKVLDLYMDADITPAERNRSKKWFEQFMKVVGVRTVRDLESEHIDAYRKAILSERRQKGYSAAWVVHRFGKVKTILNNAIDWGRDQDELGRVLSLCRMLKSPVNDSEAEADPISREDLHKLLKVADVRETAIVTLFLNAAYYPIDICRIPDSAVNLEERTVVFSRSKATRRRSNGKPIPRVAALWPRTVTALGDKAHYPHTVKNDKGRVLLFANSENRPLRKDTVIKWWKALRERAGLPEVVFSQLRDGAYTAAIGAGVDRTIAKVLLGHAVGIDDAYLKRKPDFTADACEAIRKHYFGRNRGSKSGNGKQQ